MSLPPENIRVMDAHEAHLNALGHYRRVQTLGPVLGIIWGFFARILGRNRLPDAPPTHFLNRFSAIETGAIIKATHKTYRFSGGLAFVISKDGQCIDADNGMDYIASYLPAILIENIADDAEHYLICGTPVSADDCEDPYCRPIKVTLNNVEIGQGDTDGLTHSVADLVARASTPHPVHAGELIFSGGAGGCATASTTLTVRAGDTLSVEIDGIGATTVQLV